MQPWNSRFKAYSESFNMDKSDHPPTMNELQLLQADTKSDMLQKAHKLHQLQTASRKLPTNPTSQDVRILFARHLI